MEFTIKLYKWYTKEGVYLPGGRYNMDGVGIPCLPKTIPYPIKKYSKYYSTKSTKLEL